MQGERDDAAAAITQARKEHDDATATVMRAQAERDDVTVAAKRARGERGDAVVRNVLLSERLTELQEGAKHLRALDEARRDTMRDLVGRGRAVCERFGAELQVPPAYHEEDPASHVSFYLQLVRELEAAVPLLDRLVEAECRQLLSVVATLIFSNLWLLHPVEAPRNPVSWQAYRGWLLR